MGALTNTAPFALTNYNTTFSQMCPVPTQIDLAQSFMDKSELQAMLRNLPKFNPQQTSTPKRLPKKPHRFRSDDYVQISFKTAGYIVIASIAAALLFGTCCVAAFT